MKTSQNYEYISDSSFLVMDYRFSSAMNSKFLTLYPSQSIGVGSVIEINPCDGLYLSYANWVPKMDLERCFCINKSFVKLYYFESGNVMLIQNGKRKTPILQGINLYYNKPSSGRVIYGGRTPVRYISLLLHEEYVDRLLSLFPNEELAIADISTWTPSDYNSEEIGKIFTQIREKMIEGTTSVVYYEGKIFEILSLISQNHQKDKSYYTNQKLTIPHEELTRLECVRKAIAENSSSESTQELCKIAAMSQTKLRELFRKAYGIPIGQYIRQNKLEYSRVLLANNSFSISEIAKTTGYANASKFSAAFKKLFGVTPAEFRKR